MGRNLNYQLNALNYRLTEVGRQWEGPVWGSLYVEHKDVFGLTVRATVSNVLAAAACGTGPSTPGRRTGPISFDRAPRPADRPDLLVPGAGEVLTLSPPRHSGKADHAKPVEGIRRQSSPCSWSRHQVGEDA